MEKTWTLREAAALLDLELPRVRRLVQRSGIEAGSPPRLGPAALVALDVLSRQGGGLEVGARRQIAAAVRSALDEGRSEVRVGPWTLDVAGVWAALVERERAWLAWRATLVEVRGEACLGDGRRLAGLACDGLADELARHVRRWQRTEGVRRGRPSHARRHRAHR